MKIIKIKLTLISLCLLLVACTEVQIEKTPSSVEVGFSLGEEITKTSMNADGLSASWSDNDCLAVWARNSSGSLTLNGNSFRLYGSSSSSAFFTSTLSQAMPEDRYTYYITYPEPVAVSGAKVSFNLPSVQDGRAGGGADILIANPHSHGPLRDMKSADSFTNLNASMEHILHHFRFYVPENDIALNGEPVQEIELVFPKNVVGKLMADYTDPSLPPVLSQASNKVVLKLTEPLYASSADELKYAIAAIAPCSFSASDSFTIRAYTMTQVCETEPVSLNGRTFQAGHSTPVKMLFTSVKQYARIRFTVSANNLGEDAYAMRLTAPDGCVWGDGSRVYEYRPGDGITAGTTFEIGFENMANYRAFSGKSISVTFETEHVDATVSLKMPNMSTGSLASLSVAMPYLLYENFSTVDDRSSSDEYATFSTGNKAAESFLNGWTAARFGAKAGKCVRIACRRETSADYDARVDSAPIIALKKSANISVTFDYGANNEYGGLFNKPEGANLGQTVFVGYVTDTKGYDSDATDGTYDGANSFYLKEYTGSYDSTPNTRTFIINSAPTGTVRISWRTEIEHNAGVHNTTAWLYVDNVKVQIAK